MDRLVLKNKAISSFAWKLLERCGAQGVSLIIQIVLARILVPSDFAELAIIIVFANLANIIVQSGLNNALIQRKSVQPIDYSTVLWISISIAVFVYILLFLLSSQIAFFYSMPDLEPMIKVFSIVLFINAFNSVQIAFVSRNFKFRLLMRSTLVAAVLSGAIGIILAYCGIGAWALIVQQLLNQVFSCCLLYALIDWRPTFEFSLIHAKEMFNYGWKVLVSSFVCTLTDNMYDLVVGKLFSADLLGFFSQGRKYPTTLEGLFDQSLQSVLFPTISRMQDSIDDVRQGTRRSVMTTMYIVVPVLLFFAACSQPLIDLVLTDKWLPAVQFFQIFCIASTLTPISICDTNALYAIGRTDVTLRLDIIKRSLLCLAILFTGFVVRDIYCVALVSIFYSFIAAAINSFACKRLIGYKIRDQLHDVMPSYAVAVICAVMSYIPSLFIAENMPLILLQTVVMGGLYILISKLVKLESYKYLESTMKEYLLTRKKTDGK